MLLTQERMEGFNKVLAEHPSYKVVYEEDGNWEPVKSGELATQMFAKFGKRRHPGGIRDGRLHGGADRHRGEAGRDPGRGENNGLIVTGSNCFKVGIESIEAGEMYGTATEDPGRSPNRPPNTRPRCSRARKCRSPKRWKRRGSLRRP